MSSTAPPAGPPTWLADGVIYEIYPQSFADSNGDGIGDLQGVIDLLDHLVRLGVDIIWFNPCFASPFRDAGYDVSDYLTIAPRYGTNDDMVALIEAARSRGIRVLLDLVAGHTSIDHPWFVASSNDPADDRYVWAEMPGAAFVPGTGSRPGWYLKNFFPEQPALNFGYARLDPDEPWRQPPDAPGPRRNREALREIIAFWLDRGVAGFRVDMAFSLVKDDPGCWRPPRCGARSPTGCTPAIPAAPCCRRATRPGRRSPASAGVSMRTSPWSSTRSTVPCSTTGSPGCCPGRRTPSPATSIPR